MFLVLRALLPGRGSTTDEEFHRPPCVFRRFLPDATQRGGDVARWLQFGPFDWYDAISFSQWGVQTRFQS